MVSKMVSEYLAVKSRVISILQKGINSIHILTFWLRLFTGGEYNA